MYVYLKIIIFFIHNISEERDWFHDKVVPNAMGYTIRNSDFRYTEYVKMRDLGDYNWEPEWENPIDHEELYDLRNDPQENINV